MKVALCTEILYPLFGVERRVYEMARRLPKHGFEVDLFTSTSKEDMAELDAELNINHVSPCTVKVPPKRNYINCLSFWFNLFRRLSKQNSYDVIDANGHLALVPCSLAGMRIKKPVVATIHDLYTSQWGGMYKSIMALPGAPFEFFSARMPFDRVLCVNTTLRKKLVNVAGLESNKVKVVQSGIDTKFIDKIKSSKKDKRIIYVGRLAAQKNVDMLIRSYARLDKSIRDEYELWVVGAGNERQKLEDLARRLGVNVIFTGFVSKDEDVIRLMKKSEIFVLPSRRESLGLSVLEAMYCSCAVVSTACDGPRDYIKNNQNGMLTAIGSDIDMAKALEQVTADSRLRKHVQKNARKTAKGYDWNIVVGRIAKVYDEVLG
jgi:glycosyltransferase involved in cell wall biosynthesis